MSANMRRTTLPLPGRVSRNTRAPARAAARAVSSVELLSKTKICRVRQRFGKAGNDAADGQRVIVAGQQDDDLKFVLDCDSEDIRAAP